MSDFPFFKMVAAVTMGSLIAAGIQWGIGLALARAAADRAAREFSEAARELEAEAIKQQDALNAAAAERGRQRAVQAAAQRDAREGRYMRASSPTTPVGELACLGGRIARRETNGWQQQFDTDGSTIKCRTTR
jgi:hypothetical protein